MDNLTGKKIAMVFGQSIEGCGVTRIGTEMQIWAKRIGLNFDVYSYDERKYNRRDAHALDFIPFMKDDIPNTVQRLNEYDAVIFNSYPSAKFDNESIKAFYYDLVKQISTIKVGFMHELNKTNIDKVPYLLYLMNDMDLIYNFGESTWFAKEMDKAFPSKKLGERIKKFTMMFNFEGLKHYRDEYPLESKDRKLVYCSRWTTMKGPRRVLELADLFKAKGSEITCELKGIERSIGAKGDIFDHPNTLDCTGKEPKGDGYVPVYGPYVRDEGMEYMAKNLFVASFYRMPKDPNAYGDRMEFAQIESIAVGSIPVFDKHWGENNRTKDGRRYIDIPYSAVYGDIDNLEETVNQIIEINNSKELQEKYRETSYQIAKSEFDVNEVMPEMINYILSVGKDTNKFKTEEELLLHLTNSQEFVELAIEEENKGEILVTGVRELCGEKDIFLCVLDGKKEKEIKKWKRK